MYVVNSHNSQYKSHNNIICTERVIKHFSEILQITTLKEIPLLVDSPLSTFYLFFKQFLFRNISVSHDLPLSLIGYIKKGIRIASSNGFKEI